MPACGSRPDPTGVDARPARARLDGARLDGPEAVVDAYVRLGLAFDRLERGFVDAWTGPAEVRAQVESGPVPRAADLARRARELLAELPSAGLAPERTTWLHGQLTGLACSAEVMARSTMFSTMFTAAHNTA